MRKILRHHFSTIHTAYSMSGNVILVDAIFDLISMQLSNAESLKGSTSKSSFELELLFQWQLEP